MVVYIKDKIIIPIIPEILPTCNHECECIQDKCCACIDKREYINVNGKDVVKEKVYIDGKGNQEKFIYRWLYYCLTCRERERIKNNVKINKRTIIEKKSGCMYLYTSSFLNY